MNLAFAPETAKGLADLDPKAEFTEGLKLLKNDYPQKALERLQRAYECDKHNPYYISFLGLSMARVERKSDKASELCEMAVQLRPTELQFHLNLGEVYAAAGLREKALDKLDSALERFGQDARLKQARGRIEKRSSPVLPILGREHFLNRKLGKLRHRTMKRLGKNSH
jgi:tetratricopeptide (TPR) repeat protein